MSVSYRESIREKKIKVMRMRSGIFKKGLVLCFAHEEASNERCTRGKRLLRVNVKREQINENG